MASSVQQVKSVWMANVSQNAAMQVVYVVTNVHVTLQPTHVWTIHVQVLHAQTANKSVKMDNASIHPNVNTIKTAQANNFVYKANVLFQAVSNKQIATKQNSAKMANVRKTSAQASNVKPMSTAKQVNA